MEEALLLPSFYEKSTLRLGQPDRADRAFHVPGNAYAVHFGFASVDIKNCGDGRIFVLEQNGQINILDTAGNINPVPFLDIVGRVLYSGEQGCLGSGVSSDFATSRCFM